MPAAEVFLDSNVLLYFLSDAAHERAKRDRAAQLIGTEEFGISHQVLMEVWSVSTGKMKKTINPAMALAFLDTLTVFPCVHGTPDLFRSAVLLQKRHQLPTYDAGILAAALELGAHTLYSEDFCHDRVYDGVRVINPFLMVN